MADMALIAQTQKETAEARALKWLSYLTELLTLEDIYNDPVYRKALVRAAEANGGRDAPLLDYLPKPILSLENQYVPLSGEKVPLMLFWTREQIHEFVWKWRG